MSHSTRIILPATLVAAALLGGSACAELAHGSRAPAPGHEPAADHWLGDPRVFLKAAPLMTAAHHA